MATSSCCLETSTPTKETGSMTTALPCECELAATLVLRFGRLFGLSFTRPAAILLGCGLARPRAARSTAGRVCAAFFATLEAGTHADTFVSFLRLDCNI